MGAAWPTASSVSFPSLDGSEPHDTTLPDAPDRPAPGPQLIVLVHMSCRYAVEELGQRSVSRSSVRTSTGKSTGPFTLEGSAMIPKPGMMSWPRLLIE